MAKIVGGIGVVNARELGRETSQILEQIEAGTHFLVMHHGRPVATVSPITEDALEDFVLANHRDFIDSRQKVEEDFALGGGAPLREVLDPATMAESDSERAVEDATERSDDIKVPADWR